MGMLVSPGLEDPDRIGDTGAGPSYIPKSASLSGSATVHATGFGLGVIMTGSTVTGD